jgi:hypothetical protein
MKVLKWIAIAIVVYVGIVALFESLIGYFQPANESTLVITTTDEGGEAGDRVVSRLESGGKLYVAANHWPRAWYEQALQNPNVAADVSGAKGLYVAVPVTGAEHDRVNEEHALPIPFRILTGFPPRYLLRLDPR